MIIWLMTLVMLIFMTAFSACDNTDDNKEPDGPVIPKTPAEIMQLAADSLADYMGRDKTHIEGLGTLSLSYSILTSKIGDVNITEGTFSRNAPDIDSEGYFTADKQSRFRYSSAVLTLSESFASLYPQGDIASMNSVDNGVVAISAFEAAGIKQEQLQPYGMGGTPEQIIRDNIDAASIDALLPYAVDPKYKSEPPNAIISFYVNGGDLTFSPVTISIFTIEKIEKISFSITLTSGHELVSQKITVKFSGKIAANDIIPSLSGMTTQYQLVLDLMYKDQNSGYSTAKIETVENRLRSGESLLGIMTEYNSRDLNRV